MKKMIAILLCALTVCSLGACAKKDKDENKAKLPNPFVDCDTMADAAKLAGFDLDVPDSIDKYTERTIQAIKNDMIQVIYTNEDGEIRIRKATGSEDISGDSTTYAETSTVTIGDLKVTFKGADGKINIATWTKGDYSYAVSASGEGLDKTAMTDIIDAIDSVSNMQIPNPYIDCDTTEDAAKLAGFELTIPDAVNGYANRTVQAIKNEMIQVLYQGEGDDKVMIRKAVGSEDISGDYNVYDENNTVTVNGLQITTRGADGKICVATWTNGGYTYAVCADNGGVNSELLKEIIAAVQ